MAKDMIDLLRSCNAWVDPNLLALCPESANQGSKRKRRKLNKIIQGDAVVDANIPTAKKIKKDDIIDSAARIIMKPKTVNTVHSKAPSVIKTKKEDDEEIGRAHV